MKQIFNLRNYLPLAEYIKKYGIETWSDDTNDVGMYYFEIQNDPYTYQIAFLPKRRCVSVYMRKNNAYMRCLIIRTMFFINPAEDPFALLHDLILGDMEKMQSPLAKTKIPAYIPLFEYVRTHGGFVIGGPLEEVFEYHLTCMYQDTTYSVQLLMTQHKPILSVVVEINGVGSQPRTIHTPLLVDPVKGIGSALHEWHAICENLERMCLS